MRKRSLLASIIKRTLDVVAGCLAVIALSPILLVVAALVARYLGRPILFKQVRAGLHGRPFVIYKFRTMTDDCDEYGRLLPDEARLTPFGHLLRNTSLDELPELFNVIKGDMSLVGPRPLLMQYLDRYTAEQARRHEVKPGITGWAQINGRNGIGWDERLALDVWYVDHWSIMLDLKIVIRTVWKVIRQEGISADGYATMPEFRGNKSADLS